MKKKMYIVGMAVAGMVLASCGGKGGDAVLRSEKDTLSWAMGMSLAETAKGGIYPFDDRLVQQAFESTMKGEQQPLDEETYSEACRYIAFMVQNQQREEMKKAAETSAKDESALFEQLLKDNPQLKKAQDGIYYEVVREGHGPKAKAGLRVKFDFASYNLRTGEPFVDSHKEGGITHVVGRPMFAGLLTALQMMNAGSKYVFYFPSSQAFGAQGADGLPPYTPLKYEIELIEIYND